MAGTPRDRRYGLAGLAGLIVVAALVLASCGTRGDPRTDAEIQLRFVLPRDLPLSVSVHRRPSREATSTSRAYEEGEPVELGPEVPNGDVRVDLDVPEPLMLVVRNPLDRPVQFWSAPHLPTPHQAEPALAIVCFCTGETHEVPAHGIWTRPIEVGIRRGEGVDRLVVTHVITEGAAPTLPAGGREGGPARP